MVIIGDKLIPTVRGVLAVTLTLASMFFCSAVVEAQRSNDWVLVYTTGAKPFRTDGYQIWASKSSISKVSEGVWSIQLDRTDVGASWSNSMQGGTYTVNCQIGTFQGAGMKRTKKFKGDNTAIYQFLCTDLNPALAPVVVSQAISPSSIETSGKASVDLESLEQAKQKCSDLGFPRGTPKFGQCVLKLTE